MFTITTQRNGKYDPLIQTKDIRYVHIDFGMSRKIKSCMEMIFHG